MGRPLLAATPAARLDAHRSEGCEHGKGLQHQHVAQRFHPKPLQLCSMQSLTGVHGGGALVGAAPAPGLDALEAEGRWRCEGLQRRHVVQDASQECLFRGCRSPVAFAEALQDIDAILQLTN